MINKLKQIFLRIISIIKNHPVMTLMIIFYFILAIGLLSCCLDELIFRLNYETKEIGNWDTFLYYTVGHALSEGRKPYLEMYENKPPMIFLLSALSYKLWGNYYLTNIFSCLSFIIMVIAPILFCIICWKKYRSNLTIGLLTIIFVVGASILFTIFSEEQTSEVQIESFGTSCLLISMLFCYLTNLKNKLKFYSPCVIFCGVFLGLAIMFKEPFAVIGGVVLLMFSHNKSDLLFKVIIPFLWAGIICIFILLISNCFVPYFTIYLNNMFTSHITIYGSPFERMKNIKIIFDYMYDFSKLLPILVLLFLIVFAYNEVFEHYSDNGGINAVCKLFGVVKTIVFLYAISFVVGLGGQYYCHHHIFAMPFYFALLMNFAEFVLKKRRKFLSFSDIAQGFSRDDSEVPSRNSEKFAMKIIKNYFVYFALIFMVFVQCSAFNKTHDYVVGTDVAIELSEGTRINAKYIDDVLDATDEKTYLWIGFNGYNPYAYTKHLPSGPCFAQDVNNFQNRNNFFVKSFKKQLDKVNVIVMPDYSFNLGVIEKETRDYVLKNFTEIQPDKVVKANIEKPESFGYVVLYRSKVFF